MSGNTSRESRPESVIIDSDDVLADPARMLSKYCAALGIPYSDGMIAWDDDPGQADNWWLPFTPCFDSQFFRIVHQGAFCSKGFRKPSKLPALDEVSFDVRESYEFVKPYYEEMYNERLMPWVRSYGNVIHCFNISDGHYATQLKTRLDVVQSRVWYSLLLFY